MKDCFATPGLGIGKHLHRAHHANGQAHQRYRQQLVQELPKIGADAVL